MVCWQLGEEQRRALDALRSSTTDPRVLRNVAIILLSGQGRSKERIAVEFGCSLGTVNNVRREYRLRGLAGLTPAPRPGRRSRATAQYRSRLHVVVLAPPQSLGYKFRAWSVQRLAQHMAQETGIVFGEDQLRRILRQEGLPARLRWRQPEASPFESNHRPSRTAIV
jgi:transposase